MFAEGVTALTDMLTDVITMAAPGLALVAGLAGLFLIAKVIKRFAK